MKKKILIWIPRIFGILVVLLLFVLSLDVFMEEWTLMEMIIGFFIHLIPFFLILIVLLIAWKWELIGGILYIVLGIIVFILYMNFFNPQSLISSLIMSIPLIIIGLLFLLNHFFFSERVEKEIIIFKKEEENRFYPISLILGISVIIIIIGFFFSLYFRIIENERIFFSIDMGLSFVGFLLGFLWNVINFIFLRERIKRNNLIKITIFLGCCFFLIGFLLEFFWMYDSIVFP